MKGRPRPADGKEKDTADAPAVFRGLRVYLPLIFLLFAVMIVFLPLSAGWMARRAEKEIFKRTGLPVKIERLELTLAQGKVEAAGVTVAGQTSEERPFRIGRLELSGNITSLLSGNEAWPAQVTIDGMPALMLERDGIGSYELHGGFRTLLDQVEGLKKKGAGRESESSEGEKRTTIGHTPRIIIRGLPVAIDPVREDLPAVAMTLDRLELEERPTADSPFRASLEGIALADSLERFSLNAIYLPNEKRAGISGKLSGVSLPFNVRPLGDFTGRAKNLTIDLNGRVMEDGKIEASLNAMAGYFEIAQDRLGGERWEDEPVEVRLRAEFDPTEQRLKVAQLSLSSAAAKIDLNGEIALTGDLPGEAHVHVERVPRGALALLQNEMTERMNVTIDAADTSPTLQIEGSVSGNFAKPEEMNSFAAIRASGWSVMAPALPGPVVVRTLDLMASRDEVELRDADIDFSGMKIRASGIVPICAGDADKVGEVTLSAEGDTESVFDFLSRRGLTPPEMNYARLPVTIDVKAQGRIDCDDPVKPTMMTPRMESISASLTWKTGEIGLRDFAEPIRLEPGRVVYTNGDVTLERFSASAQRISVKADGKVTNLPLPLQAATGKPLIDGSVSSTGELPDLVALLNRHITLPPLPRDLVGQYQLTLSGHADTAEISKTDYKLRLLLDKVSATIETPNRPLRIADFSSEISLDRDVLDIRRGNLRVNDEETGDSTVEFTASADRTAIRANVDARTKLELLPTLLPQDLKDIYMKGTLAATGWGHFTPRAPLNADKSVAEAWAEFLKKPGLTVNIKGEPDLLVNFELANKQEEPVEFFPRDFPVRITNIRGGARFTPGGIILQEMRADFGSAKDVLTSGTIQLGQPLRINFSADVKELDVNEWMNGWGEREWAAYSASFEPKWKAFPGPYMSAVIDGKITTEKLHFLRYDGDKIRGNLHFESWSRIPSVLNVTDIDGIMYGGPSKGDLRFQLTKGETPTVAFRGDFNRVQLKPFMDALYEREQKMDGLISAQANFSGHLMDYPTYKGDGRYAIERSAVIGNVILDYARSVFEMTSSAGLNSSTITGTVSMYDQKVFMPDLVIKNPNINLTADGYLDFRGRLFFDVTASVLAKRLQEIPVIRFLGDAIDLVGNQIVSYEVRGTLKEPKYKAVLTPVGRMMSIRELLKESEKAVILPEQEQTLPAPLPPAPNGQK